MRRLLAGTVALLVAGVASASALSGGHSVGTRPLLVGNGIGLTAVDPDRGTVMYRVTSGMVSPDGATIAQSLPGRLWLLDARTGRLQTSLAVPGTQQAVRAVAPHGHVVVLGDARPALHPVYLSAPRTTTPLTVVGPGRTIQHFALDGNYEPEAVSRDGSTVFLIQYLPALAPTRYRIRELHTKNAAVTAVPSVDGDLRDAMRGVARTQAWSPDGRRLYTLYVNTEAGTAPRAFVHVLDVAGKWAHCVDLPAVMATPTSAKQLAVAPDSRTLYVADPASGAVSEVDTKSLKIRRTERALAPTAAPSTGFAVDEDHLYLGRGGNVLVVDRSSLAATREWTTEFELSALAAGRAGYLHLVEGDQVEVVLSTTGQRISRVGLVYGPYTVVAPAIPPPVPANATCAC